METRTFKINLETAKIWFESGNDTLAKIAAETFPELIEVELPKRWEDLKEVKGFWIDDCSVIYPLNILSIFKATPDEKNTFTSEELAEATLALAQLSQLREVYRNGWLPDWSNKDEKKYAIYFEENKINTITAGIVSDFLSFQDEKTRDLFLENFEDLIKKTLPLFS